MKKNIILIAVSALLILMSCKKDCGIKPESCQEAPPTDELCQAYFTRWFYNQENDKCALIGYSGCSAYGFATKEDCSACICR